MNWFFNRFTGVDVKPAKGGMFDDLGEVARHLQRIGAKLDPPNDPEMANILEQYGVVNHQKGLLLR